MRTWVWGAFCAGVWSIGCGSSSSPSPVATTDTTVEVDTQAPDAAEVGVADAQTPNAAEVEVAEADAAVDSDAGAADTVSVPDEDLDMKAEDFPCVTSGTKVRRFYVWNLAGHEAEALAVANSDEGGAYPVGTLIQLVPSEAMVKRRKGFSAETNDWEFFALDVSAAGTTIVSRGAADTVNQFGGNCASCHSKAAPKWDLVCEQDHGCDPLPLTPEFIEALQDGDPRCGK